ncbi:MAG TPA: hypothetical protein G4O05_02525, partial [Caldilineae bacterium]|nr:hypothetical protein [Caldilineae bacterium]
AVHNPDKRSYLYILTPAGLQAKSRLTYRFLRFTLDFYEQVEAIMPYVSHLHLSDASGIDGEGLQIGDGGIDWVRFFEVVGDFRGTMIPEIWRGHQRGGEGFIIAINRLSDAYFKAKGKK